jgi:hypothetical protein
MMKSLLASAALALASSTCCPSVFLTVTKGSPGPVPSLPPPTIVAHPWEPPRGLINRFDVFGPISAEQQIEFDKYDPNDDSRVVSSAAVFGEIAKRYGIPGLPPKTIADVDLCLVCTGSSCNAALVKTSQLPANVKQHPRFLANHALWTAEAVSPFSYDKEQHPKYTPCHDPSAPQSEIQFAQGVTGNAGHVNAKLVGGSDPKWIASFVHVSDIQIRDPEVKLGDALLS